MNSYIVLFAAVLAVAAAKGPYQKCPWVTAKYPFDEAKFAGDWNVLASLPNTEFGEKKCAKFSVAAFKGEFGTTLNYKYSFHLDGKPKTAEGISYCKGESKGAKSLFSYKKDDETKFSEVYMKFIVATDYDTYALSISCRPTFDSETKEFGRDMYASILSRGKTLSADTIKTLKSFLTTYDIEYDAIKAVDHTDC